MMALGRPSRKVLGQEPHPALARIRALPRKINCMFGDSADGESWGSMEGWDRKTATRSFGECFIARWRQIGRRRANGERRQAIDPISTSHGGPLCLPLGPFGCSLPWSVRCRSLGSGVWVPAPNRPSSHTHTRLRHGDSGCRTSNSSPDIFNHGETSLCLFAWNRPGLYSRTSLTRALALLSSPRRGPSSWASPDVTPSQQSSAGLDAGQFAKCTSNHSSILCYGQRREIV